MRVSERIAARQKQKIRKNRKSQATREARGGLSETFSVLRQPNAESGEPRSRRLLSAFAAAGSLMDAANHGRSGVERWLVRLNRYKVSMCESLVKTFKARCRGIADRLSFERRGPVHR
jgi:hypothetical protein